MGKVIYPWSFDPFTYWHEDIITRAWEMFEVVIWVWQNPDKKYMFSFPERVKMILDATNKILNVQVLPYSWLLVDFAFEQWITTIVRGIRWSRDLEDESYLHWVWESQKLWIDTIFLLSKQDQTHISSSTTKAILREQWMIQDYVPLNVKHFLEARMMWQYIIWLTWTIWAGKSYIAEQFVQLWNEYNIPVHNIDLDKIWHWILEQATDDWYKKVRQKIIDRFWDGIKNEKWFIDRKKLGENVFNNPEKRKELDEILYDSIILRIRKEMKLKKWIVLLNWALLAESWILNLPNNNMVVVWVNQQTQQERLSKHRGLGFEQIERRVNSQFSTEMKKKVIQKQIDGDWYWDLIDIENNWNSDEEIKQAFNRMVSLLDVFGELRIQSVLSKLGFWDKFIELYWKLKPLHDTPERLYHNWFHIVDCLNKLYEIKHELEEDEFIVLFFAILFHDSVYNTNASFWENENNSANFSETVLKQLWLDSRIIERIKHLINLTSSHTINSDDDVWKYMVDIDLSILWQEWEIYYQYAKSIRYEYSNYSDDDYNTWRLSFLRWMLNRQTFQTQYFQEKYERQAKSNIEKEIQLLQGKK